MPVCNKCQKQSNCLTIDPCDHCGAKDWNEATVLTSDGTPKGQSKFVRIADDIKTQGYTQTSQSPKTSQGLGCLFAFGLVAAIAYGVYYFFLLPDSEQLSDKYNVPAERVSAPPKPHGCAFNDAPLGDKHCHYDKHVYVYDRKGQAIEIDGKPQTCPAGCGPAYNVEQVFTRVDE
jgi:hypothetical protein